MPPLTPNSLFKQRQHPFVWTKREDRAMLQINAELPLWNRFIEETDLHFSKRGELALPEFPVFCHDGDLDEVMALAVLAYVTGNAKYWQWIAQWLKKFAEYFQHASPLWSEHRNDILRGKVSKGINPGQWFEGFTKGGRYWVEAGLMSSILHLLDLLESEFPLGLSETEQGICLEALSDYATRYAFHEEAVKYSNRGIWANAGVLISAIASADPVRAQVLLYQCARRNEVLRTTFFDDGMHCEGSSDYHLMALDGILCYTHLAETIANGQSLGKGRDCSGLFGSYPSFTEMVKAVLQVTLPGEEPWTHPRGSSVSVPLPVSPPLVYAHQQTEDTEIAWFIKARQEVIESRRPTPLAVTPIAVLGLGSYQPLRNFWCYRAIRSTQAPRSRLNTLKDHGGTFSRSGWHPDASTLTLRHGYQGSAKGHHDLGHVLVKVGKNMLLCDPFPRHGPAGQHSSLFHNTVTVNRVEPSPSIGRLLQTTSIANADSFLMVNHGGSLPNRPHLHDPREESNYWFTDKPGAADFNFHRALLHLHEKCVIGIDVVRTATDASSCIDWFFHSHLRPEGYDCAQPARVDCYRLRPRNVLDNWKEYSLPLQEERRLLPAGSTWQSSLESTDQTATLSFISPDCNAQIETGHHHSAEHRSDDGIQYDAETDYFFRLRTQANAARLLWILDWSGTMPSVRWQLEKDSIAIQLDSIRWQFNTKSMQIALSQEK